MNASAEREASGGERDRPPRLLVWTGKTVSLLIARAPMLWPLLRRPTRRFWERSAAGWDERIGPDRPEHLAPLTAACDQLEAEPRTILELGIGTGSGALMLARRYPAADVRGVDISPAMVRAAEAKLPGELAERVRFAVADSAALPFDDEQFDLVAQLNVPVYPDEAARVLRPGGSVVVASSLGSGTPYFTPDSVLRRLFARQGLGEFTAGHAGESTYFLARRPAGGSE